ncbi:MAG: hypothetical protein PUB97_04650 [Ruminococcus sp.]|nr:hypothetical protein [Ruminococcus sp.]
MIVLHLEDSMALDKTAYGVLSTMLNVPKFDNVTVEQLMKGSPDSEETIRTALSELIEHGYVVMTEEQKYAVIKERIFGMKKM